MNLIETPLSPVHGELEARGAQWGRVGQSPIAVHVDEPRIERQARATLALCDCSPLSKLGVKGPGTATWLGEQGVSVSDEAFESRALADGGVVVNLTGGEFFAESGPASEIVPKLAAHLGRGQTGVFGVERQDATFLLSGGKARQVLAQVCGIDFDQARPRQLILTRTAGVTCAVLPQPESDVEIYRLWVDHSHGLYLWQTLVQISGELGGRVVGAACFYPGLQVS